MKTAMVLVAGLYFLAPLGAEAAGLCNCCSQETQMSCATVYKNIHPAEGQCIAAVDLEAKT